MIAFLRGNPRYLRYWMSTWASELGDWIRNMTLMYLVYDWTNGSAEAVSFNSFFEFAPIFLLGPFVGVFVDRWNRKQTILTASLLRAVMIAVLMVAVSTRSLWLVYLIAAVSSTFTVFFRAPATAFISLFVRNEDRKTTSALRQMSSSVFFIIGPSIGTVLYQLIGGTKALLATALLFLICTLLITSIRVDVAHTTSKASKEGQKTNRGIGGVLTELKAGFQYAWSNKWVRPILFSNLFFGLGGGLLNVLSIFVLTEFLHLPKEMFSLAVTVQGAGMLLSSILVGKLKLKNQHLLSAGVVLQGVGMWVSIAYPSFYSFCAGVVILSLGVIMYSIGMSVILQTKVAYEYQGRLNTTVDSIGNGFMVFTMVSAGWFHDMFSVRPVIVAAGVFMLVAGICCSRMYAIFSRGGAILEGERTRTQ